MMSRFAWPAVSLLVAGGVTGVMLYWAAGGRPSQGVATGGSRPGGGFWRLVDERSTRLFVQTVPPRALVLLDGRILGRSDGLFRVESGWRVLRVDLPGYGGRERLVAIGSDRVTRVRVDLTTPPGERERLRRLSPTARRDLLRPTWPPLPDPGSLLDGVRLPWNTVPEAEEPPAVAVLRGHTGEVTGVGFSADGRLVVSSAADGTVRIWEVASGQMIHVLAGRGDRVGSGSTAVSPDGKVVASCPGTTVYLLHTDTGDVQRVPVDVGQVRCLAFAPEGNRLICAGGRGDTGRLAVLDPHSATVLTWFRTRGGLVQGVAFSPDGRLLAYAHGATVRVVSVAGIRSRGAGRASQMLGS